MSRYLLDTNIISDLVRNPAGRAAGHLSRIGEEAVCTSIVVAAELRYGAAKKESRRLSTQLEAVLETLEILPLEQPVDSIYAALRVNLEERGTIIGANDLLIAAHTMALDCILVTDNEREFSRVASLTMENWLR
ncbi:MAG: type II toxin-antitoxin system VapC family toxin [Verrucomicrobia bacterium]|nr:type II toxin-antitoxin system VapC family toxin [Verrucomicrobiota bacterium]